MHATLESDANLLRTSAPLESGKRLLKSIRKGDLRGVTAALSPTALSTHPLPESLESAEARELLEKSLFGALVEGFIERSPREVRKGTPSPHPRRAPLTVKTQQGPERTIFFELVDSRWCIEPYSTK